MKDNRELVLELTDKLTKDQQQWLLRMIARISEASYRRGAQQAYVLHDKLDEWITNDKFWSYRFDKSLMVSIGLDGFRTTSIERLLMEEPYLHFLAEKEGSVF